VKNGGWETTVLLARQLFRGQTAVSFGEGKTSGQLGVATPPPSENLGSFGVVPLSRIPVTTRTIIFLGLGDPY